MQRFSPATNLLCVLLVTLLCSPLCAQDTLPNPSTGNTSFDECVAKATDFLRAELLRKPPRGGSRSLAAYALVKAGLSKKDPIVQTAVNAVRGRINVGTYTPTREAEANYEAPVDAMLLAAVDAVAYRNELQAIAAYLIGNQATDGSWDYPGNRTVGDTSQCQYAILGLWACHRSGIQIAPTVWDRCAAWHVRNQSTDGGWAYHPGKATGPGLGQSTHNMTFSGMATMAICQRVLYPQRKKKRRKLFGRFNEVSIDEPGQEAVAKYKPNAEQQLIRDRIAAGKRWLAARWLSANPHRGHKQYFYYAMERAMALNGLQRVEEINWYRTSGEVLQTTQQENGSWTGSTGVVPNTSFGILFFLRATTRDIEPLFGAGIAVGNKDGFVIGKRDKGKREPKKAPLAEVLTMIDEVDLSNVQDVPEEDLNALADYALKAPASELSRQIPLLKKLVQHPSARVRERVVIALGRTGRMRCASALIDALADNDVNVLFEANHSLCLICRKPGGIGVEWNLLERIMELPMDEIAAFVVPWRRQAQKRWREWYVSVRPYDDRGDLWELQSGL